MPNPWAWANCGRNVEAQRKWRENSRKRRREDEEEEEEEEEE
jgi:hypothetical protein